MQSGVFLPVLTTWWALRYGRTMLFFDLQFGVIYASLFFYDNVAKLTSFNSLSLYHWLLCSYSLRLSGDQPAHPFLDRS
jgi:hypothetical protein